MAISLEALAMSGADYIEYGMDIEEWELLDSETPPHLLADEEDEQEETIRPVFRLLSDWKTNPSRDNEVCDGFLRKIHSGRGLERIQEAKLAEWLKSFGKMMINPFIRLLVILRTVVGGRLKTFVST